MAIKGWEDLVCKCGGKDFVAVYHLQNHPNQGTTTRPDGYFCLGCQKRADQGHMVLEAKKRDAERQIRDLESTLNG